MSDFYSDLVIATPRVVVPRFGPPGHITFGPDRIPDYVEATSGSPYQYIAPEGFRLAIFHYGVRIQQIVAADRKRGFAIGLHYRENDDWTITHLSADEHGHRFYQAIPGQQGPAIRFALIYAAGRFTPPEIRHAQGTYKLYG